MLVNGKEEERAIIVYLMFDYDGDLLLSKGEFENSLKEILRFANEMFSLPLLYSVTSQNPIPPQEEEYAQIVNAKVHRFLQTIQKDKLTFPQFRQFLSQHIQIRMFFEYLFSSFVLSFLSNQSIIVMMMITMMMYMIITIFSEDEMRMRMCVVVMVIMIMMNDSA
jgi:hypothetical protein